MQEQLLTAWQMHLASLGYAANSVCIRQNDTKWSCNLVAIGPVLGGLGPHETKMDERVNSQLHSRNHWCDTVTLLAELET